MKDLLFLLDYRGQFYSSIRSSTVGFRLDLMRKTFEKLGYNVSIDYISDVEVDDIPKDTIVLYQSSEDQNHHYKHYIHNILILLEHRKLRLLPDIDLFRCHDDKGFQSLYLKYFGKLPVNVPKSRVFGASEDLRRYALANQNLEYPLVVKRSSGCTSKHVYLANSSKDLIRFAKRASNSSSLYDFLRIQYKKIFRRGYVPESMNRRQFIIQEFIAGLSGDYKVVVYGDRYYPLYRMNRKNDFRASGSGHVEFLIEPPSKVLDAAKRLMEVFRVPYASFDLADTETGVYLIEFQFMMFGTLAIEKSEGFFVMKNGQWIFSKQKIRLEEAFAESIDKYLSST